MCIAEQPPTQLQKPQTPIPFLSSGWYISSIVSILWVSFEFHIFVGLPYKQTCIIKLGFFFPPVNLSFITVGGGALSQEPRNIEGKLFFSSTLSLQTSKMHTRTGKHKFHNYY